MRNLLSLIAHAPLREAVLRLLPPLAAAQAAPAALIVYLGAAVTILAPCAFAAMCCSWAVWERARVGAFRRSGQRQRARFRVAKRVRDTVIANGKEAVQLYGADLSEPLNFGNAASQTKACAAGPDCAPFLAARQHLLETGAAFDMDVRTRDDRVISVRGRPLAGYAALFLHEQSKGDAGFVPLDISATTTDGAAIGDFPGATAEHGTVYISTQTQSSQQGEAFDTVLERLTDAIAVFGSDRELIFYNRTCAQLWDLPPAWLDTSPTLSRILDRLRETAWLPAQCDFAAWKAGRFAAFDHAGHCSEELWHLPAGKSLRVLWQVNPTGGITAVFQDITDRLAFESSRAAHSKVQKAMLEIFPESAAIFGPDGRLRQANAAFRYLFELREPEVCGEPHMANIAALSPGTLGDGRIWELVAAGVNSPGLEAQDAPVDVCLADGRILSVELARLPDGSTFAGFSDVSDFRRLEDASRERAASTELSNAQFA